MEKSLRTLAKQYSDTIIVISLIALGFLCFYVSVLTKGNDVFGVGVLSSLMTKVGTGALVSALAWTILNRVQKSISETIESKSKDLDNQAEKIAALSRDSQIVNEARETGIEHIFRDRGITDKEYQRSLIEHFRRVPENGEIKIQGVTLSRFFGPKYEKALTDELFEMLNRGVKMKLLMLDPRSEAAIYRANTDQAELVSKHGYISSSIFRETYDVVRRLAHPTPDWCLQEDLIEKIKSLIEVRLYDTNPVAHLIILNKYIYVEQYHNGGGIYIRDMLRQNERHSNLPNYTGFVPVFKVKRESIYAHTMLSHFDNIWNHSRAKSISSNESKVYEELFDFLEEEWSKRSEKGCL